MEKDGKSDGESGKGERFGGAFAFFLMSAVEGGRSVQLLTQGSKGGEE